MTHTVHQLCVELVGIPGAILGDQAGLAGVTIPAAGALGLSPYGTHPTHSGPQGTIIALLCHGGHVLLHALPEQNVCLVDIVARSPQPIERGIDMIALRLGAAARRYGR